MNENHRATSSHLARVPFVIDCVTKAKLPTQVRIVNRLADLLFDADEVLGMLEAEDAAGMRWIEDEIRPVYDRVNDLMMKLTD